MLELSASGTMLHLTSVYRSSMLKTLIVNSWLKVTVDCLAGSMYPSSVIRRCAGIMGIEIVKRKSTFMLCTTPPFSERIDTPPQLLGSLLRAKSAQVGSRSTLSIHSHPPLAGRGLLNSPHSHQSVLPL